MVHNEAQPQEEKNPIYECRCCERLVETQQHGERSIVPRYCPWCGQKVSSIIGRVIGDYKIEKVLAAGGFGIVYLASNVDETSMKKVVKILRPQYAYESRDLVDFFLEEARLTQEISNSSWNVVGVSTVRRTPWPYLIMEYIEGTTLAAVLREKEGGKLDLAEAKGYLRGIASALEATHKHNRVHRDLKPVNIMVIRNRRVTDPEKQIKLLDFGLAMKVAGRKPGGESESVSVSGRPTDGRASPLAGAGTPEYMPPEAFDGETSFCGDIYAFGVTAYEVLAGKRPWESPRPGTDRLAHWHHCHKEKSPRSLHEVRSEVPKWLGRVVMDCLEKDPGRRIQSAEDLLKRLREPVPLWGKLAAVGAVLLVLGLFLWGLMRPEKHTLPWTVDGAPLEKERLIWLDAAGVLRAKKIAAAVPEGRDVDNCSASPRGVVASIAPDRRSILLEIPNARELLGQTIVVEGSGRNLEFKERLQVARDDVLPTVGPLRFARVASEEERPLGEEARLHPRLAEIRVEVADDHFREAVLLARPVEGAADAEAQRVPSSRSVDGGKGGSRTVAFSLETLRPGSYVAWVEAEDAARNRTASPRREAVTVDEGVDLAVKATAVVARGKAFFEVSPGEKIGAWKLRDSLGAETPAEVFRAPRADPGAIELARTELSDPVSLPDLAPGSTYLVAVPLPPREGPFSFTLEATDTAFPANTLTPPRKLTGRNPGRLTVADLGRVTLDFGASAGPYIVKPAEAEQEVLTASEVLESGRVDFVDAAKDKVLGFRFAFGSESPREQPVSAEFVRFERLTLKAQASNPLVLKFRGALDEEVVVPLRILCDTEAPKSPEVSSQAAGEAAGARFHKVSSGREIKLLVRANEPLARVIVSNGGKKVIWPPASGGGEAPRTEVAFADLEALGIGEGRYNLQVEVTDRVGHTTPASYPLVNSSGPPQLGILPAQPDAAGVYKLEGDSLSLKATDGNGIDWRGARLRAICQCEGGGAPATEFELTLTPPGEPAGADTCPVTLGNLLHDQCHGELRALVPDALGNVGEGKWRYRFLRTADYAPEVKNYKGIDWVLVDLGPAFRFYVGKHEVSNAAFTRDRGFVQRLMARPDRPRFLGKMGEAPAYVRADGSAVGGERFPVTGITPGQAEEFAATIDAGARLPTWDEWHDIAGKDNRGGDYPWKDENAGKRIVNYFLSWEQGGSPFRAHVFKELRAPLSSRSVPFPYALVEVDFAPAAAKRKDEPRQLFHLLGNVAELVLFNGGHAVAGGSFDTPYDDMRFSKQPQLKNVPPQELQTKYNGFRLVIALDRASAEFKAAARSGSKR